LFSDDLIISREAGPEIFVQSHLVIVPSGSLELSPFNRTLSVGKVTTWSDPATAIGGLFPSTHPSQEISFLQEKKITNPNIKSVKNEKN